MKFTVLILSTLVMLIFTILNGFPLVYYDSAYYLWFSWNPVIHHEPILRPLIYSLLPKISHSVFLTVLIQSLWLNLLIYKTAQNLKFQTKHYIWIIAIGVFLTPMGLYTNFFLPDIFIAIQFLAFFNMMVFQQEKKWKYFCLFSFLFASMTHYSNLILTAILGIGASVLLLRKQNWKPLALLALPVLVLPLLHFAIWNKLTITNSASFFLFSRLTALSVTDRFLNEKCPTVNYKLCIVREIGFDPWNWGSEGAIFKAGGYLAIQSELRDLSYEMLTTPKYAFLFLKGSLVNWGRQFLLFSEPIGHSIGERTTEASFREHREARWYESQRLHHLSAPTEWKFRRIMASINLITMISSLIACLLLFKTLHSTQRKFFGYLAGALILNSMVCGILTEPMDRYQARLIFLFPIFIGFGISQKFLLKIQPSEAFEQSSKNEAISGNVA